MPTGIPKLESLRITGRVPSPEPLHVHTRNSLGKRYRWADDHGLVHAVTRWEDADGDTVSATRCGHPMDDLHEAWTDSDPVTCPICAAVEYEARD